MFLYNKGFNQPRFVKKYKLITAASMPSELHAIENYTVSNLTIPAACISESCIKKKINLNFSFHTSLWCLKRFYEGL